MITLVLYIMYTSQTKLYVSIMLAAIVSIITFSPLIVLGLGMLLPYYPFTDKVLVGGACLLTFATIGGVIVGVITFIVVLLGFWIIEQKNLKTNFNIVHID